MTRNHKERNSPLKTALRVWQGEWGGWISLLGVRYADTDTASCSLEIVQSFFLEHSLQGLSFLKVRGEEFSQVRKGPQRLSDVSDDPRKY